MVFYYEIILDFPTFECWIQKKKNAVDGTKWEMR